MKTTAETAGFLTRVSADVIYGTIVLETVLGALSDPLPGNLVIVMSLVISVAVVSIAGTYAQSIRKDMEMRIVTPLGERSRILARRVLQRGWMLAPLLVPIAFFGLARMGTLSQTAAYAFTRVALLGVLFFFGFMAAILSGASVPRSMLSASMVTLLGYVVVQAKVLAAFLKGLGT